MSRKRKREEEAAAAGIGPPSESTDEPAGQPAGDAEPESDAAPVGAEAVAAAGASAASVGDAPARSGRITPVDIQQKVFRASFRGYNEREVDQFLDSVTEEVARLTAEAKGLREALERAEMRPTTRIGAGDPGGADEARVEAADILASARDEAARLVAEARSEAVVILGGAGAGQSASATGPGRDFIHRERDFLQNLAALIQEHAEAIREDLKRSRGGDGAGAAAVPGAGAGAVAASATGAPAAIPADESDAGEMLAADEPEAARTTGTGLDAIADEGASADGEPVPEDAVLELGEEEDAASSDAEPEREGAEGWDHEGATSAPAGPLEPWESWGGEDPVGEPAHEPSVQPWDDRGDESDVAAEPTSGAGEDAGSGEPDVVDEDGTEPEGTVPERSDAVAAGVDAPADADDAPADSPEEGDAAQSPGRDEFDLGTAEEESDPRVPANIWNEDPSRAKERDAEADQEGRSLRELFWGEE
jgi:DivIVA domain-containing protein